MSQMDDYLIKLADRLCNLRDMDGASPGAVSWMIIETEDLLGAIGDTHKGLSLSISAEIGKLKETHALQKQSLGSVPRQASV